MVTIFEFNEFVRNHTLHVKYSVSNLAMNTEAIYTRSIIHDSLKKETVKYIVSNHTKELASEYHKEFQLDTVVMTPEEFNRCIDFAYREGARKVNFNMELK